MSETIYVNYAKKLGISVCSIMQTRNIILNDIQRSIEKNMLDNKQCFHIIGPAGVGKTQITYQIAEVLSARIGQPFEIIMIKSPVLSRDDFIIPFPSKTDQTFEMLYSQFIPRDPNSYGLFVIDEFSRGDQQLQQLMWQIQNENKVHTYDFPKNWFVISIDNPDDEEYSVNNIEDAAGLRRCLHIYTSVSVNDFLNHASLNGFHQTVIDFISKFPRHLYDFESQKKGMVFSNPASWEKVSDHMWKYDQDYLDNLDILGVLLNGLLNSFVGSQFLKFIKSSCTTLSAKDVIENYPSVHEQIKDMVKKHQNDTIHSLLENVFDYIISNESDLSIDEYAVNLAQYLLDLPKDVAASFIVKMGKLDKSKSSYMKILQFIMKASAKNEEFQKDFVMLFAQVQQ